MSGANGAENGADNDAGYVQGNGFASYVEGRDVTNSDHIELQIREPEGDDGVLRGNEIARRKKNVSIAEMTRRTVEFIGLSNPQIVERQINEKEVEIKTEMASSVEAKKDEIIKVDTSAKPEKKPESLPEKK